MLNCNYQPKSMRWEKLELDNSPFYSSKFFKLAALAQTDFGIFFLLLTTTYVYYFSFKSPQKFWGDFYILLTSSSFYLSLSSSKDIWWKSKSIELFPWIQKVAMGFLECNYDLFFNLRQILMIFFHSWSHIDDIFSHIYRNEICFWKNCSNTELMKRKSNPKLWKQNGLNCHYWKAKSKKYLPC